MAGQNPGLVISGALHELVEAQSKVTLVRYVGLLFIKVLGFETPVLLLKSRLGPITELFT
jgi:hypothetical protein